MKIGIRLVVIISIFNIIGIGLLAGVTLISSQREIGRLAEEQAYSLAVQGTEEIKNWLGTYVETARALANIMQGYKDIPAEDRREYFNFMMKQTIIAHPEVAAVYANWAPNALDNMDAEYANTPGTNASGRYISGLVPSPQGPQLAAIEGFEFDMVMQVTGGEEFIFEPSVEVVGGKPILGTNICIPVKDQSRMVGSTGIGFELSSIQAIADTIKPLGDGYAMVFSSGGLVAAHPDSALLGKNIQEIDTFGDSLDTALNAVTSGKAAAFFAPSPQGVMHYYAIPFSIGKNPKPWTLMVAVSRNTVMAPVYRMLTISLIIGAFTMILMSFGGIFIARSVSRPIAYTMGILKYIAEGDLTKQIEVHSKDELGDLARYLNWTIDRIKTLIFAIRNETDRLSHTGSDLVSHTAETAAAINQITANIQSIKTQVSNQALNVAETASVTQQKIESNINALEQLVGKQVRAVSESSTSIDQMLANIQSVTQTLVKNVNNIITLSESSEVGHSSLQEVGANIREIAEESAGLLEINGVMENISSQTNLLSMNAAIEAAHAGEAGKGFSVVASEIRKLAELSASQSKTISTVLKKIKLSIDKITASTEEVLTKFELIGEGIQTVTNQEKRIRDAMEEQGGGSKGILEALKLLHELTNLVKQRTGEMLNGTEHVLERNKHLGQLTEEITGGVNEIATGANQINMSMEQVASISVDNQQRINALAIEVAKFKVS
ncbi:MAG: methyl-accepting chemotaxis protein [Treponema sp.]|jgi:methyl-accepting chemotaxis protein|nr:methyl-accepting chemotaxis protein [Treponema sp.]